VANIEKQLAEKLKSAERQTLIELLRSNPDMSLAEVLKVGSGRLGAHLEEITVGDLLGGPRQSGRRAARRGRRSAKGVDTRTKAGRDAYDAAILDFLKNDGGAVAAATVRAKIGGTALQARTALARLIDAGRVTWQGKARSTRYTAL
jgi:hypothetical protein